MSLMQLETVDELLEVVRGILADIEPGALGWALPLVRRLEQEVIAAQRPPPTIGDRVVHRLTPEELSLLTGLGFARRELLMGRYHAHVTICLDSARERVESTDLALTYLGPL